MDIVKVLIFKSLLTHIIDWTRDGLNLDYVKIIRDFIFLSICQLVNDVF